MLGPLLFLMFINDLADELKCNHLFFAGDLTLISELRSSIQPAFSWSRRGDFPLNASKGCHLSTGGPPDLTLDLFEEAEDKSMQKCELINDVGLTVYSAFTLLTDVLTAPSKARGMLYFIKRSFTCLMKEIFVPLFRALVTPHLEDAIKQSVSASKRTCTTLKEYKGQQ